MSKRSNLLYLGDMFDHARRANERVAAVSRDEFMRDEDLQIVVMHHVRIVGEAASRLSSDIRDAHPEIPWVDIIGMRHVIVHDYFKIKVNVLWETATQRIPDLIAALETFVPRDPPVA